MHGRTCLEVDGIHHFGVGLGWFGRIQMGISLLFSCTFVKVKRLRLTSFSNSPVKFGLGPLASFILGFMCHTLDN